MITISFTKPSLVMDEVHTATHIIFSRNSDMSDPFIDEVISLPDNLLRKTYDYEVTPKGIYYAQARFEFSPGGLQPLSNVHTFLGKDGGNFTIEVSPPVKLVPPTVAITPVEDNVPLTNLNFKLDIPNRMVLDIEATSWILTNIQGDVVQASMFDSTNKTQMLLDAILTPKSLYQLRYTTTTTDGHTPIMGGTTFVTGGFEDGDVKFDYENSDLYKDKPTKVVVIAPNLSSAILRLYGSNGTELYSIQSTSTELSIQNSEDLPSEFTISVVVTDTDGTVHKPIYEYITDDKIATYPQPLPVATA